MKFNRGDIVLVPFPFSDLSNVKRRPVLILSEGECSNLITCGITSNLKNKQSSILIEKSNLSEGAVPVKSLIKVDKLFTLEKSIVIKKIGRVNKEIFDKVKKEFIKLI